MYNSVEYILDWSYMSFHLLKSFMKQIESYD